MASSYAIVDAGGSIVSRSESFDPAADSERAPLSGGWTLLVQRASDDEAALLRRQLQDALHENAAKESFLSSMSHDLRTPMNAIVGLTALAKNHIDEKSRVMDTLNKIETASGHLLNLINDVLDVSRINSGRLVLSEERFTLSDMLHEVLTIVRPMMASRGHDMTFTTGSIQAETLKGDTLRLRQIYVNIISNAAKYTPDGGHIDLRVEERVEGDVCRLIFVCRDDGVGMTEAFLQKIFDPFERVNSQENARIEGTGLGMNIVKRLIDAMNGEIAIDSAPGKGTTVKVTVPLKWEKLDMENGALEGKRLLIIEADDALRDQLSAYLLDGGAALGAAADGAQALEALTEGKMTGQPFDGVIIGQSQENAASPFDIAQYLHKYHAELPLIWVSDADWSKVEYQAQRSGITAFIPQPVFRETLLRGLQQALRREGEAYMDSAYPDLTGKRLLLVDDNMINREIAREILSVTHAQVDTAENGREAVDAYERADPPYVLILMDIQMPVMDGYEATRQIRASRRPDAATVPIIAMTANTFAEDVRRAKDAGMNGHLAKPVAVDALMQQLRQALS